MQRSTPLLSYIFVGYNNNFSLGRMSRGCCTNLINPDNNKNPNKIIKIINFYTLRTRYLLENGVS